MVNVLQVARRCQVKKIRQGKGIMGKIFYFTPRKGKQVREIPSSMRKTIKKERIMKRTIMAVVAVKEDYFPGALGVLDILHLERKVRLVLGEGREGLV
jgi:hypothetical protein